MILVKFPEPGFKIKSENRKDIIFDTFRKSWLHLTEEEWVRQNFLNYLVEGLKYPAEMIAIEKEIWLGELKKRFDILVYDGNHQPWMLVECKSIFVPLTEQVMQQVLRYNISVPVFFLIITNGHYTYGWERIDGVLKELDKMPEWR